MADWFPAALLPKTWVAVVIAGAFGLAAPCSPESYPYCCAVFAAAANWVALWLAVGVAGADPVDDGLGVEPVGRFCRAVVASPQVWIVSPASLRP